MTDWTQERLEKFWRGLGAKPNRIGFHQIEYNNGKSEANCEGVSKNHQTGIEVRRFSDPSQMCEVPLEVLLDGLERLNKDAFVFREDANWYGVNTPWWTSAGDSSRLGSGKNRRTAIIAAICKLLEIEEVE